MGRRKGRIGRGRRVRIRRSTRGRIKGRRKRKKGMGKMEMGKNRMERNGRK